MNKLASIVRNARIAGAMAAMQVRSLISRKGLVSDGSGVVVSLTSYSRRTAFVHLAIESIARGSVQPERIILWLDSEQYGQREAFPSLARLTKRGLEVRPTTDLGPHKKYYPYVNLPGAESRSLVTADDDTIYPRKWLQTLISTAARFEGHVIAHRAHSIKFERGATIAPYERWGHAAQPLVPSFQTFPVGVGGVLYPPRMIGALRAKGDGFLRCAPRADDVWLHFVAVEAGVRPVATGAVEEASFLPIRGAKMRGLESSNVAGGGNDKQVAMTYSVESLRRIRDEME